MEAEEESESALEEGAERVEGPDAGWTECFLFFCFLLADWGEGEQDALL